MTKQDLRSEPLPHWASAICDGDYMLPGAQLLTRDGLKIGNGMVRFSVFSEDVGVTCHVITDIGTTHTMTLPEMKVLFYPPKYIMRKDPAHKCVLPMPDVQYIGPYEPKRATDGAAGYDIRCGADGICYARSSATLVTNLRLAIPVGYVALLKSRSGLAFKWKLETGAGVIDSDYRGEIGILVHNFGDHPVKFKKGERVCQMLIIRVESPNFVKATTLDNTKRGDGGFGHTGSD